jgi:Protein of unknown function (DUF3349)
MTLSDAVSKILAFIRAGYPQGVPPTDYYPLLALLRHRLTDDEVGAVAEQLASSGELHAETADISAAITAITTQAPSGEDLNRVRKRLEAIGWTVDSDH